MDSHSRSASPREPMRPQHRPPSPPASPGAFDNRAYQHDEDPNHNESFSSNGPQQNGQNGHKPNGDTKLEAVNLELINLTPKNGTKKKDVEVDLNTSNPYDEYFVPVNEHRKYMRGEKLYVTADKRGEKGGCKRPLCWTLLVLLVAAIVALIVLAATGVLFTSSPTTVEQYNSSITSARAFGNVIQPHDHHDHNHDHSQHDTGHDTIDHDPRMSDTPVEVTTVKIHEDGTQNDEAREPIAAEDSDMSVYVPRTLEGELKIDNEEFTPSLQDPESNEYKEFVASFADGLKRALFNRTMLESGNHDIFVEVVRLKKGSVVVTYRIHWKPKANAGLGDDLMNAESLQSKLDNYLSNNNRMINIYHVAEDKLVAKPVLDVCQMDNNLCEHGCEFDETTLDFTCTCPHGQMHDISNPKKCMSILDQGYPLDPNDETKEKDYKVLTVETTTSTTKTISEKEKSVENENTYDWPEVHQPVAEPTTEKEGDLNFSHLFGHEDDHEHTTVVPEPEPNAEPERSAEPQSTPKPTPNPEPEPTSEPGPEPTTTSSSVSLKSDEEGSISLEVIPSSQGPVTKTTAFETIELEPVTIPEPNAEPEPTSEPEPTAEPQPAEEPEPKPEPEAKAEPTAEPEPSVEPEPKAEPKPVAEPEPTVEPEPSMEFRPELEPKLSSTAEPVELEAKSETESSSEFITTNKTNSDLNDESYSSSNQTIVHPYYAMESKPDEFETNRDINVEVESKSVSNSDVEFTTESKLEKDKTIGFNYFELEPNMSPKSDPTSETKLERDPALMSQTEIVEPTTMKMFSYENNHFIETEPSTEHQPFDFEMPNEPKLSEEINKESHNKFQTVEQNESYQSVNTNIPNVQLNDDKEVTTVKVSIFEANSQNSKPILLSILSNNRQNDSESGHENNEWLENKINYTHINNESEQRSFKSVDIYADEMTTLKTDTERDKTSLTGLLMDDIADKGEKQNLNIDNLDRKTTEINKEIENPQMTNIKTVINSLINQGDNITLDDSVQATTMKPEISSAYSITQHQDLNEEEKIMDALTTKTTEGEMVEVTTESKADEGMDITFDTINMLYNRSSKSIEKVGDENKIVPNSTNLSTTTELDWLSEPVTEINYEEAMNTMNKHTTTEAVAVEEVMKTGVTKDDFEPDYLNTNNKMTEDVPLYGLSHDYDTEDSRVKRVQENTETSKNTTFSPKITNSQSEETKQAPFETTTIVQYIYKSSEQTETNNTTPLDPSKPPATEISEPAPVWEETEKELSAKELSPTDEMVTPITSTVNGAQDEIVTTTLVPSTTVASETKTPEVVSMLPISMTPELENKDETTSSNSDDSQIQNTTQVNNLNVTIYEISSHNSSVSVPKVKAQSSEYDDHETEMNPFLPEVENNKVLVKKLQEGHDLEPINLNETQNENFEEHKNISEITVSTEKYMTDNIKDGEPTTVATTKEIVTTFSDLMTTNSNLSSMPVSVKKREKETVSTFLLDTDDLDTSLQKSTNSLESSGTTQSNEGNDDSEYLSVVPIEDERIDNKDALKRSYANKKIQQLNDISDSPKKSDRRTIDVTKFDSVNNNEA